MTRKEKINTLKAIIQECEEYQWQRKETLFEIIKNLEQEPEIGHWIKSQDSYGNNHFTCPFCGNDIATKADTLGDNYCSNCGVKLQESEDKV